MTSTQTKTNKPVRLPRGYISWSSLDLLEQNERKWVDKYCNPDYEERTTIEMEFGKRFAEVMEGQDTSDDIISLIKLSVPAYAKPEEEITATLNALGRAVKLLGKPDSYDPETHNIYEYKTGKTKWNQDKAQKHGQVLFYKTILYINHGVIPKGTLIWIPTEDSYDEEEGRQIAFSGALPMQFVVEHSYADILKMMQRIMKGALRMEELYLQEINNLLN